MVPSVVWLQCVFRSKPIFFHFSWFFVLFCSQCRLAPICFPLKIHILGGSPHFLWFPVLFGSKLLSAHLVELLEVVRTILELEQEFWIIWSVYFSYTYSSQILRHNNANIGWLLSGETWKYWIRYMYEKYRTPLRVVRYFSYMQLIQYFQVSPSSHPILYQTWVKVAIGVPSYVNEVKSHVELFLCELLWYWSSSYFLIRISFEKFKSDYNHYYALRIFRPISLYTN